MTRFALLTLITSEGTSSNVCELTPSGTSPMRSILSPPTFLTRLVMGDTDVTTFNLSVSGVDVMVVLVLLKFGLEANDSEMQVTFKPRNIRQNAILLLMVMGLYIIL